MVCHLTQNNFFAAAAVNNDAVLAFEQGNYRLAKTMLGAALKQMKVAAEESARNHRKRSAHNHQHDHADNCVVFHWSHEPVSPPENTTFLATSCQKTEVKPRQERDDTTQSYIYKRALVMVVSAPINLSSSFFHDELACISYNLALTNHLFGCQIGREEFQRDALLHYKEAWMHSNRGASRHHANSGINMFGLAVMSNMGQICYEVFFDYDQASKYFSQLLIWLRNLGKDILNNTVDVDSDTIRGFVFNTTLSPPSLAAAA